VPDAPSDAPVTAYDPGVIGSTLGSYTLHRELGRGGMGAVFVGGHTLLGRQAAIKVLLPELSREHAIVQRFFNEARAATAIKHPGIVEIYDFGYAADGSAYIVMELLSGEPLADRLRRGRMPAVVAAHLMRQTAIALGAAHQAGIVHRDLKPDNIYLVPDAETAIGERVKLLDFGIAKLGDASVGALARTSAGTIMGTPYYMAPEQCRGDSALDHRADLYALGCVLYEMLAGRPPFTGEAAGAILGAHIHVAPTPLRQIAPDAPVELESLVMRLLAKDPAARPPSAEAVVAELAAFGQRAGQPSGAFAAAAPPPGWSVPSGVSTTLGGAAGQVATAGHRIPSQPGQPPRRSGAFGAVLAIAGALVVGAGIIVGALVYTGQKPSAAVQPPTQPEVADAAPAATPPEIDDRAAAALAAVEAAVAARDGKAAQDALARVPESASQRAAAVAAVDGLRKRQLTEATLALAGLVDKRRCDDARALAAKTYDLWGEDASALTQTAAACRTKDSAPVTTPAGGGDSSSAKARSVVAKLKAAKTGIGACDHYLHVLGAYFGCDKMPASAVVNMDVDAVVSGWRQMASSNLPADTMQQVETSCRDNTKYIEQAAATMGCPI
jgi:hypothetical protein